MAPAVFGRIWGILKIVCESVGKLKRLCIFVGSIQISTKIMSTTTLSETIKDLFNAKRESHLEDIQEAWENGGESPNCKGASLKDFTASVMNYLVGESNLNKYAEYKIVNAFIFSEMLRECINRVSVENTDSNKLQASIEAQRQQQRNTYAISTGLKSF